MLESARRTASVAETSASEGEGSPLGCTCASTAYLAWARRAASAAGIVTIIEHEGKNVALFVDELIGEQLPLRVQQEEPRGFVPFAVQHGVRVPDGRFGAVEDHGAAAVFQLFEN